MKSPENEGWSGVGSPDDADAQGAQVPDDRVGGAVAHQHAFGQLELQERGRQPARFERLLDQTHDVVAGELLL